MIVFNRLKVSPGWSDKPLAFQEGLLVPQLRLICPDGEGRKGDWEVITETDRVEVEKNLIQNYLHTGYA